VGNTPLKEKIAAYSPLPEGGEKTPPLISPKSLKLREKGPQLRSGKGFLKEKTPPGSPQTLEEGVK